MSIILFIFGAGLLSVGAIKFGNIQLEGSRVRAAGITLMTPFVAYLLLFQIVNSITGGNTAALGFVGLMEFIGIIVAGSIAYILLFRADEEPQKKPQPQKVVVKPQSPSKPLTPTVIRDFPQVMTTSEAAQYLNMTEQAILELIEEGKLTAARINYRYRISRTVLDEFKSRG